MMRALSSGASDFLDKPFSTTELHVRIKNLVESHQNQCKLSKQKQALESTREQLKETETQLVQSEKLASGEFAVLCALHQPRGVACHGVDFEIDIVAFTQGSEGRHLQRVGNDEHRKRVTFNRINRERHPIERNRAF